MRARSLEHSPPLTEINELSEGKDLRLTSGAFADGVEKVVCFQLLDEGGNQRAGHVGEFRNVAGPEDGALEDKIEEWDCELGMRKVENLFLETLIEVLDGASFIGIGFGLDGDTIEEEGAPAGPASRLAQVAKPSDVVVAPGLKKSGEIEAGATENLLLEEEEGDNHPAEAPIAINEWVKDFELGVDQGQLDEDVGRVRVPVGFPAIQMVL
jgi:hypothetical protein